MADKQRVTVPSDRMVFGNNTIEMINNATPYLPAGLRLHYEAVLVLAAHDGGLRPVWSIGQSHKEFSARYYGKVTFTLKAPQKAVKSDPIDDQLELF